MALTAAEKQRRYRERRDRDLMLRTEYLEKQKKRYIEEKLTGKRKLVDQLSDREKRTKRKTWKKQQQSSRKRKRETAAVITPPHSPLHEHLEPEPQVNIGPGCSRQKLQGAKYKARKRTMCYREIKKLREQLTTSERRYKKYKMRWLRERKLQESNMTPRSRTKKLLRLSSCSQEVKKQLTFHHVLLDQIKRNYHSSSHKKTISQVVCGEICRKYKFSTYAKKEIQIFNNRKRKTGRVSLKACWENTVRDYLERDDISCLTTGKKTITRNKIKKQKRFLLETLFITHKKFQAEYKSTLSYTSFWRMKPWWVVRPTENDRETCLCKTCENVHIMSRALVRLNLVKYNHLDDLLQQTACSTKNKQCMYSECNTCKHKRVTIDITGSEDEIVQWAQWETKKEVRIFKSGKSKSISITRKNIKSETKKCFVDTFHNKFWQYRKHRFNMVNQLRYYQNVKKNLKSNEVFLHVDFAENYIAKISSQIQAMHFGASQSQISLHTGYYCTKDSRPYTFSGVSDSLRHDPCSIWAYLSPMLKHIRQKHPIINRLIIYSDGPTTQYRQKENFYMLSTLPQEYGFTSVEWNFHEASHGKGIPDGVGGAIKRAADRRVLYKSDILNATDFITELDNVQTSVYLYKITDDDMKPMEERLNKSLKTVPGTMAIHQIHCVTRGIIHHRHISCTCSIDNECHDHKLTKFTFPQEPTEIRVMNDDGVAMDSGRDDDAMGSGSEVVDSGDVMVSESGDDTIGSGCGGDARGNADSGNAMGRGGSEPMYDSGGCVAIVIGGGDAIVSGDFEAINSVGDAMICGGGEAMDIGDAIYSDGVLKASSDGIVQCDASFVGRYVMVKYDDAVYPGYVESEDGDDIFVECMKNTKKGYIWPKCRDKCWYTVSDIVRFISQPMKISGSNCFEISN